MRFRKLEIRHQIKERARRILSQNIVAAVKVCLLLTALYLVIQYVKIFAAPTLEVKGEGIAAIVNAYLSMNWRQALSIAAINILAIIVLGPLICSFCGFFIKITATAANEPNNNRDQISEAPRLGASLIWFYQKNARTKAIVLRIATTLLSVFWHVLFVGPPLYFLYRLRGNPNSIYYANAVFTYTTWMLAGFLLAYVKLGTYYPAYFLIAQNTQMSVAEALRDSVKMMKGHAWEFLNYKLSFIPWYIIAAVTFGLGLVYVVPYRGTSDALFMRYIDSVSSGGDPF